MRKLLIGLILMGAATPLLWSNRSQILGVETNKPSLSFVSPGSRHVLPGNKWIRQTLNNCAPAATAMVLKYFGYDVSQTEIQKELRTNSIDTNVFSNEISSYLKQKHNLEAKLMFNGDLNLIRMLIANGFYVMVEDWMQPDIDIGHNTVIRGYDDKRQILIADDPYLGLGVEYKYSDFDSRQWKAFNREYMPVYKKEKESLLRAIVGENWDTKIMYQNSVVFNEKEVGKNPGDMYAWFNVGTSYFALGEYSKAKVAFEKSQILGWPGRMLWYQPEPVQTYNLLGEYKKALEMAQLGLKNNDSYAELHLESAIAYRGLGDLTKAKDEVEKALRYAPNLESAFNLSKLL